MTKNDAYACYEDRNWRDPAFGARPTAKSKPAKEVNPRLTSVLASTNLEYREFRNAWKASADPYHIAPKLVKKTGFVLHHEPDPEESSLVPLPPSIEVNLMDTKKRSVSVYHAFFLTLEEFKSTANRGTTLPFQKDGILRTYPESLMRTQLLDLCR